MPLVQDRAIRRGAAGDAGLTGEERGPGAPGAGVPSALLRPVLQLAWALAREDQEAAPRALRKISQFSTLPPAALATVRRVLEEDEAFRARVVEAAAPSEALLGRPAWLWLVRPDGWEDELARLVADAEMAAETARDEQEERSARRRLGAAEEAKRRAEATAAEATAAASRAVDDAAVERQGRRTAETRVAALEAEVERLRSALVRAERTVSELEAAEAAARTGEAVMRAERDGLAALVGKLEADLTATRARLVGADAAAAEGRDALSRAVADAAAAARALGVALSAASLALGGEGALAESAGLSEPAGGTGPLPSGVPVPGLSSGVPVPGLSSGPAPALDSSLAPGPELERRTSRRRPPGPRRRPTPLPLAVFEDSAAAAEHLVRVGGMLVLVDGYNVSKRAWDDAPIPEQRRRLVDALTELVARTGVGIQVVFDGAEQPEPPAPGTRSRSPVQVRFSPPGVEADEVLIELVDQRPLTQPVAVATSDRRVQDEVRRRGANVITTPQLLELLGRAR